MHDGLISGVRCMVAVSVAALGFVVVAPARAEFASAVAQVRALQDQSHWAAAESLATAELARARAHRPPDALGIARLLAHIVRSKMERSVFRDSMLVPMAREVLEVRTHRLGASHPLVADAHHELARALRQGGQLDSATAHVRLAHEIRAARAPDDTLVAESLGLLGIIARDRSDYQGAVDLLGRAIDVWLRGQGENHVSVAVLLAEQAYAMQFTRSLDLARQSLEQSLGIFDRIGAREHFQRTVPLDYLAQVERDAGQLDRSIYLLNEALRVARLHYADDDRNVIRLMRNGSGTLLLFGDFAGACALMERVIPAYVRQFGPNHPRTLNARRSLGSARSGAGDSSGAMSELRAAEAGFAAITGPPDPQLASTRLWIGELLAASGDHPGARIAWESGIAAGRAARVPRWLTLAELQSGLVRTLCAIGDTAALAVARAELTRLIAMPETHASNISQFLRKSNALALRALGRGAEAWDEALAADLVARERLRVQTRALPDRRALQLSLQYSHTTDLVVEMAEEAPTTRTAAAWDAVVRARGLVRDEVARRRLPTGAPAAVAEAHARWVGAQREYARRIVGASQARDTTFTLSTLEASVEHAEIEYARMLGSERPRPNDLGLDSCLARLGSGQALVGVVETGAGTDTATVIAWIARGGAAGIARIKLGRSSALSTMLDRWNESLARPPALDAAAARRDERECRRLGATVRAATWEQLAPHLASIREVFMVPDGPLLHLAWQALPGDQGYFVERGPTLRVLTAERDLVKPAVERGSGVLLALGDPDFDTALAAVTPQALVFRSPLNPCLGPLTFEDLPGTAGEVRAIAKLWNGESEVLTKAQASELALKTKAAGSEVIHLATHGLLAGDSCFSALGVRRGLGVLTPLAASAGRPEGALSTTASKAASSAPSPWLGRRVWLAFAGANRAAEHPSDENEGLLTAEEVLTLDLAGTDWVVLSACHSAAAVTWSREGSLGIRRAFHLGGARTVIASQWSIEDQSTREWMTALYAARARGTGSPGEAVAAASRAVLAERRAARRSTHPFFWAAFDATGE